ncbi:hydroxymethylpyrimidine pyrophosphatase-like HAD family hydrolase [Arthrobacter sp. B2I5]|nr:hydroxymethylpyrimidine pyrophosphatase-like HAD family hydrolase [Arthrobacter sp. B2I5]
MTKASALENLRVRLGFEEHLTVAVGDGRNDIEMLTWAGRGVAMGQAPAEVVAAADEVTHSVHDDGAAHVLRSLL